MTVLMVRLVRVVIGAIFIYASWHKIMNPAEFAKIIYGYGIFPDQAINLIAICIPFVELISGICLILGICTRSCADYYQCAFDRIYSDHRF